MFYKIGEPHNLAHDPFKAIIAPRPIGWISTLGPEGVPNLAPYSFFNALTSSPPMLMFSSERFKDSANNAKESGEFSFSLATAPLQDQMNTSSDTLPPDQSEYEAANLAMAHCDLIKAPRVADSPASMECKTISCSELRDLNGDPVDTFLVIGQVVAVHINDHFIKDGRFDTAGAQPLARCGYRDYAQVNEVFELMRPTDGGVFTGVDR